MAHLVADFKGDFADCCGCMIMHDLICKRQQAEGVLLLCPAAVNYICICIYIHT